MDYPHKWRAFVGICILSFGVYLDYTVVNIALPTIRHDFHTSLILLQWVMNLFFLALAVFSSIMGRVGDLFGRIRLFYIGVIIFLASSILAGLSPDIGILILARFLQGFGAAIIIPMGMSILPMCVPKDDHAKFIGWLGSFGGLALALGPVIGALIVTYWGWRWIFFLNAPLVVIGFCFCVGVLQETALNKETRLDWAGALLMIPTVGGLVLAVINSEAAGWNDALTLTYLGVALVAFVTLYYTEKRQSDPLIDFSDFKKLLFFSGACMAGVGGVLSSVVLFFDPLYLQIVRGESVNISGLVMFSVPVIILIVSIFIGVIADKVGLVRTIMTAFIVAMVSTAMQSQFSTSTSLVYIIISLMLVGVTWTATNSVSIIAGQNAVHPSRISVATGTIVTMFNIGGSIGLAIGVVVYHSFAMKALLVKMKLSHTALNSSHFATLRKLVSNPSHLAAANKGDLFNFAFLHGLSAVMWYLFIFAVVLFVAITGWYMFKPRSSTQSI